MNMIALVSDQRMQNIIPIMQSGASYARLMLVLSKDRRTGKPLARYQQSAEDLKAVLDPFVKEVTICQGYVDPFDIGEVERQIVELIRTCDEGQPVVVNISGGTKPMAIGALRAAQSQGVDSVYTDMEDGEILWLSALGSVRKEPINVRRLDVATYIRAYGETVSSSVAVRDLPPQHIQWAILIGDNHRYIFDSIISAVNRQVTKALKEGSDYPIRCQVKTARRSQSTVEQLAAANLWNWHPASQEIEMIDPRNAVFLNGIWVEVYVAARLQASEVFDDVRLNVMLESVDGEIDVAAVANGKMVLIECKSNLSTTDHLGKLDSFRRRLGGPFAKAYYARAGSTGARRIKAQCDKVRLDGVYFGSELSRIGDEIGKAIGTVT